MGNSNEIELIVIKCSRGHKPRSRHMDYYIIFALLRFVKHLRMKKANKYEIYFYRY